MKTKITKENFVIFEEFYKEYTKELSQYSERLRNNLEFELKAGAEEYYRYQNGEDMYLINNESGTPIGFVVIRHNCDCTSRRDIGLFYANDYLAEIYIRPVYRRKGYASQTIREIIQENNGPFPLYILKGNEQAKSFWKKIAEENHLSDVTKDYLDLWKVSDMQLFVFSRTTLF